jgi:hypothetical protein
MHIHILDKFHQVRRIICIFCPLRVEFVASITLHRFNLKITLETNGDASK